MAKRRKKAKAKSFTPQSLRKQLQHINLNAAGIDIGSERHMVAVPAGRDEVSVREFGTFTADLNALAGWLQQCGVTTVAMESTGVYWIPLFELLERRRFEVKLVDGHVKNVLGRKSDVLDCQWIQQLHTVVCWPARFDRQTRFVSYAARCGSVNCSSRQPVCIFSICRKRCSK